MILYEFLIKIFKISLVYWRNTALSSLAIHKVWRRSSALSCANIPSLLIQSFYLEFVLRLFCCKNLTDFFRHSFSQLGVFLRLHVKAVRR